MQEFQETAGAIIADHYRVTSDMTDRARDQRDRIFLYLLLTLGVATLFTVDATSSSSILITGLAKFLDKKELADTLQNSPLVKNIQTLLLAVAFYLFSNLYSRTTTVLRNYQYLGALEKEIRSRLRLSDDEVAFTREGNFYWQKRTPVLNRNRQIFTLFLMALLLIAFPLRVISDIQQGDIVSLPDVALGLASLYYLWGYHRVSKDLDRASSNSSDKVS